MAFALMLALVAAASLGWLWRESTQRLDRRLAALATDVIDAVQREQRETPDSSFRAVVQEVRGEWMRSAEQWILVDASGQLVAATAAPDEVARTLAAWRAQAQPPQLDVTRDGDDLRALARRATGPMPGPSFTVLTVATTEGIESDTEQLALVFAFAAPLILLVSVIGGYLMARGALRPVDALGGAIDALGPADLSQRLPVSPAGGERDRDEIGRLSTRFNALLDRLEQAQAQNREFVREAAHQIRTPLTLVHGEADHVLSRDDRSAPELRAAVERIRTASQQMRRRVDELFLLAEAEAGARFACTDQVELDGLVLECTDLFRARAASLGRRLTLGELAPVVVSGNEPLLREALLELLENACRHGEAETPITIRVILGEEPTAGPPIDAAHATVLVTSGRAVAPSSAAARGAGLGHRIVHWIMAGHGGRFEGTPDVTGHYTARLVLPRGSR